MTQHAVVTMRSPRPNPNLTRARLLLPRRHRVGGASGSARGVDECFDGGRDGSWTSGERDDCWFGICAWQVGDVGARVVVRDCGWHEAYAALGGYEGEDFLDASCLSCGSSE